MGNDLVTSHGLSLNKQIASAGPGYIWKVYEAKKQLGPGKGEQIVSVWAVDKREIPDKTKIEVVAAKLKAGYQHLTRLKHPYILRVVSPLQEDKHFISFETEPIIGSLANAALKNYSNLAAPTYAIEQFQAEPMEMKRGLYHLASAVHFIHRSANLIHLNLGPESVVITADGSWKLCGFEFACPSNYKPGPTAPELFHTNEYSVKATSAATAAITLPNLDYSAPEMIFHRRFDYASDIFSVGCLMYNLFAPKPLMLCQHNTLNYKQRIEHLFPLDFARIPSDAIEPLSEMLSIDLAKRWDSEKLIGSQFFGDLLFKYMIFTESLPNRDPTAKVKFFKAIPKFLSKYTPRILKQRLLPYLLAEMRFPDQVPLVLPLVFEIAKLIPLSDREFKEELLPWLLPLFNKDAPNSHQIFLSLLAHMEFFLLKAPESVVPSHVVPLLCWAIDSGDSSLQDTAVQQLSTVAKQIPYTALVRLVLPRLSKLATSPSNQVPPFVRVNSLICLGKLFVSDVIDHRMVAERVLPTLEQSLAIQCTPEIFSTNIRVYLVISKRLAPEIAARKVLPILTPLLCDPLLEKDLFLKLIQVVQELLERVREWRLASYQTQVAQPPPTPISEVDDANALVSEALSPALGKSVAPAAPISPHTLPARSITDMQYEYALKREEVAKQKAVVEAQLSEKHQEFEQSLSHFQPSSSKPSSSSSSSSTFPTEVGTSGNYISQNDTDSFYNDASDPYQMSSPFSSPFGASSQSTKSSSTSTTTSSASSFFKSSQPSSLPVPSPSQPSTVSTFQSNPSAAPSATPLFPTTTTATATATKATSSAPSTRTQPAATQTPPSFSTATSPSFPTTPSSFSTTTSSPSFPTTTSSPSFPTATSPSFPTSTSATNPISFPTSTAPSSSIAFPASSTATAAPPSRPEAEKPAAITFPTSQPAASDVDAFDFGGFAFPTEMPSTAFEVPAATPTPAASAQTSSFAPIEFPPVSAQPTPFSAASEGGFDLPPALHDAEFTLHIDPSYIVTSTQDDKSFLDSFFG